ncbi:MAG: hypothetical protein ACREYF_23290, partial [Gammaproteobacteria bacterium]
MGPNDTGSFDDIDVFLTASHQLNDAWTVRGGFSGSFTNDTNSGYLFHGELLDDNRTLILFPVPTDNNEKRYALYLDTTG